MCETFRTQPGRYEHTEQRVDTRAGHYERRYHTKAGEVTLRMPKLRKLPFETAIIGRYRRHHLCRRSTGFQTCSPDRVPIHCAHLCPSLLTTPLVLPLNAALVCTRQECAGLKCGRLLPLF
jgi:hypothetical protein